ncbi:MAG TPA: hypothetical protein PLZ46_06350, partial [Bacteroidales bacterium]|nr:hypothetical protein [Bacteroidales bacterium]
SSAYPGSGLARFVRHVFWLRPGLLIVVDDLESKKTAVFDWLLHTEGRIISEGINVFLIKQAKIYKKNDIVGLFFEFSFHFFPTSSLSKR